MGDHEVLVGKLAEKIGFSHISISSSLMPMVLPISCILTSRLRLFLGERARQQMPISRPKSKNILPVSTKASKGISAAKQHDKNVEHAANSCNLTEA